MTNHDRQARRLARMVGEPIAEHWQYRPDVVRFITESGRHGAADLVLGAWGWLPVNGERATNNDTNKGEEGIE